jgi:N-acylneuraminate cytidylyltransferase
VKDKNILEIGGHPLLAYAISAAITSKGFSDVVVSTDSALYKDIAEYYGAKVVIRPNDMSANSSPDIEWVVHTLGELARQTSAMPEHFAILRPTNPFRSVGMILAAINIYELNGHLPLRAIELVKQHPYKMWKNKRYISPLVSQVEIYDHGWERKDCRDYPTQILTEIYVQNGSMQIAPVKLPMKEGRLSYNTAIGYITVGYEGYDINDEKDWLYAKHLVSHSLAELPKITRKPYETAI